jgi:hypothetical protein
MLGFTLGKSTLADVEVRLGKSELRKCAIEEEQACYVAGTSRTRMVFEAVPVGCLEGFRVISGSLRESCYRGCPRAYQLTGDLQTEGGLRLGLTREKLIALLGRPKEARGNRLTFEWDSRKAMTKEEEQRESKTFNAPVTDAYWDVEDIIDVTLADSKVVEFEVSHVVTY